jgi:type VI secretion system secreted protein VgrG
MSENRTLRYTGTQLDADALALQSFQGKEQLGRLFRYTLNFVGTAEEIEFADVLNREITVTLDLPDQGTRHFHGVVARFVQTGREGAQARYEATVVPKLWFLTRKSDCRIYQRQNFATLADVIFDVLERNEIEYEKRLDLSLYRELEFCVQYRETDFDFISRLMEQEGIYYYFAHEDGAHKMILCDSPGSHEPYEEYDTIPFSAARSGPAGEGIYDWVVEREVQTGSIALGDFDFQNPTPVVQQASNESAFVKSGSELFDYPGAYTDEYRDDYVNHAADGERYARVRAEELRARGEVYLGEGDARGLAAGHTFTLEAPPRSRDAIEYLIVSAAYRIRAGAFESGESEDDEETFACSLTAIDSSVPFRPLRVTAKPVIQGPQTAKVVGEGEVDTDKYGRVKVQFPWDRHGAADRNSSCWIRVAQAHAGQGYGGMDVPRVGDEVVVQYLEGDPDRPIVTGRVYNAANMPPLALPGEKTKTILRDHGSNEINMEGAGPQQLRLFSPTENTTLTLGAAEEGGNLFMNTDGHQVTQVKGNRTDTVDGNVEANVVRNVSKTVRGNTALSVHGNVSDGIRGDVTINIGGKKTETVNGPKDWWNMTDERKWTLGMAQELYLGLKSETKVGLFHETLIGGKISVNMAFEKSDNVRGKMSKTKLFDKLEAGQQIHRKAPNIHIDSDNVVRINAGDNFILIDSSDIRIKTPKLTVECANIILDGNVKIKGDMVADGKVRGANIQAD